MSDTENMMIPEAAVEAAGEAARRAALGERFAQELYDEFYYMGPREDELPMTNPTISDEAVEAALAAMRGLNFWDYNDADYIRAALEAAAPHMLAGAWDDGHSMGIDHADGLWTTPNPYAPAPRIMGEK
jgi:hypothetical protein